jgi:hypothetical protein
MLFANNWGILGQLVTSPVKNFTCATHTQRAQYSAIAPYGYCFIYRKNGGSSTIYTVTISRQWFQAIQKNCEILKGILEVMIFCGKQNVSLRGHRESMSSDANLEIHILASSSNGCR